MNKTSKAFSLSLTYLFVAAALLAWQGPVAGASLVISPLTWPTAGLDSNNVNAGPNHFPIGMRACASGGAVTNVKSSWTWTGPTNDPTGTYVYLRPGTLTGYSFSGIDLANGECYDFYYEIEIKRDNASYGKYRSYQIAAWADSVATATGPIRQVGVEYLISQSRNSVQGIDWGTSPASLTPLAVGGTMDLVQGNTYYIRLRASTATNGYEQLESFINFPNTIFQVLSATSTYSANTSPYVTNPSDKLYANGCNWDEEPTSPTYASCLGVGKAGGTVTVLYEVKILAVPTTPLVNPEPLNALIYDFSGSSFHYNADFSQTWYVNVLPAARFEKSFDPNPITLPTTLSTLTFTITNLTSSPLTAVSFDDTLPTTPGTGIKVATTPGVTKSGCDHSSVSAVSAAAGALAISASAISIAANGTCTISVNVDAPYSGTYDNVSEPLWINGGPTDLRARDSLVVLDGLSRCQAVAPLATWNVPGSTAPPAPNQASAFLGAASTGAVSSFQFANAAGVQGISTTGSTLLGGSGPNSWSASGPWYLGTATVIRPGGLFDGVSYPYYQFALDTSRLAASRITISFSFYFFKGAGGNDWASGNNNIVYVYSSHVDPPSTNDADWTLIGQGTAAFDTWISVGPVPAATTGAKKTYFRVIAKGANNSDATTYLDDVVFTSDNSLCNGLQYSPPTITKSFLTDPIFVGQTSTLQFTITNPPGNQPLTNVEFEDILPGNVLVGSSQQTSVCGTGSTLTTTPPNRIQLIGGSLAAAPSSCTMSVTVTGAVPGTATNESGHVSSGQSGPNPSDVTDVGVARDTITVQSLRPAIISKVFSPNPIFNGTSYYSTLTFTITNPNPTAISQLAFTDALPAGSPAAQMVNSATVYTPATSCGGNVTATPGSSSITLSNASLGAGASCTVRVNVTTPGPLPVGNRTYNNTSGPVSFVDPTLGTVTGNTASATLTTRDPVARVAILKQIGPSASGPWSEVEYIVPLVSPTVYFRFIIENTGDVPITTFSPLADTVSAGTVTVTACNTALAAINAGNPFLPGATLTCVSSPYTVTTTGTNYATVTATTPSATATSNTVNFALTELRLDKTVTSPTPPNPYTTIGQTITYSYLLTNLDKSTALTAPITVHDDRVTVTCPQTDIPKNGGTTTCTATYTVTANDVNNADAVFNSAYATAYRGTTLVTSNTDTATVPGPPFNYGGLPVGPFDPNVMNVFQHGGVRNLSCNVTLGTLREANSNGGPASDPTAFDSNGPANTWDGVSGSVAQGNWTPAAGGLMRVVAAGCTASGGCYLNGWINWAQDGDFVNSAASAAGGDRVFTNYPIATDGTYLLPITMPLSANVSTTPGTWYARFRLTSAQVADPPSPTGAGGCGEVEDVAIDVLTMTTTPVTLAYFHAYEQGGRIRFDWTTASEVGNFGFDIFAGSRNSKGLEKVTAEPVGSTATDPTQPQDYTVDAGVDASTFYLEDVDVLGARRRHGPFELGKPYGKRPEPAKTDWTGIRRERAERERFQNASAFLALAAEKSKAPLRANLLVGADGLYRITYEALKAAGFDFGDANPKELALVNRGRSVPIEVTGPGNKFGPGSAIQFYGTGLTSIYTRTNVYVLQTDRALALRVEPDATMPSVTAPVPVSYSETVRVENAKSYDAGSPAGDPWYDTRILAFANRVSRSFPITLDWVSEASGATLTANYFGVTGWPGNPDHHVLLGMNGTTLRSDLFDGRANRSVTAPLPVGLIREGANTMTLDLPGDTGVDWDMVALKSYAVTYPRQFVARDGRLSFEATGTGFRVDRLPSANAVVYRIAGDEVVRLEGATIESHGIGYSVRFPGSDAPAKYVVTTLDTALVPGLSAPRTPSGLVDGPADFLVVSHPDFLDHLGPLVAARQAEGLSVKVVDVRDVYAQYGHDIFDPAAIKSYVSDASAKMGTRYVLLVGGDTYDYRDDLKLGTVSFIPTLYARTDEWVAFAPADPLFGDVDGDDVPDVAVGRFPVRTVKELDSLIRKTLAYGNAGHARTAVFASDAAEPGVSYKAISESFIGSLSGGWDAQRAHLDDGGLAKARKSLLEAMNSGVALANFVGHSSFSLWTFDPVFDDADARALTNFGKPLFVSQFGCWNTYFVSPYYDTLGHAFLLSGDQGAAGVMGASALTEVSSDKLLGEVLFPRLTVPGKRIGDALNEAKREAAARRNGIRDVLVGWVLLADPTLVIQR